MNRFSIRNALILGLTWASCLQAADTAGSGAALPLEAYPLEHYLTGIAERQWTARAAQIAQLKSASDVQARAAFVRAEFLQAIGGLPGKKTPLNARITGAFERPGYRVEKVVYESLPGCHVTANLYLPTTGTGPFPAVLGAAGHAVAEGKALPVYQSAFIALAMRGYVVLAYDPPGQGERLEFKDPRTGAVRSIGHISPGLQCLLTGGTSARYFMWDGIRGLDYLLTRPEVDPRRIAAAGNSGGGTQSAFLAVCEPRLAAVASSCYWTSWELLWKKLGPQDSEQVLPNSIAAGLDFSDLALAFAPKPLLMLTATKDSFPVEGARRMYAEARPLFRLLDAEPNLGYFEYDDGHGWSKPRREATVAWFDRWLYGRTDAVEEPVHAPESVQTLRCTDTGHVLTALGSKTMQKLNEEVAEALYPQRSLATPDGKARAREVIHARLGIPSARTVPIVRVFPRTALGTLAVENVTLAPEPGIELRMQVIMPAGAATPRPAVIFVRDDLGPVDPTSDPDVMAWSQAGHVVVLARLRGIMPVADNKAYYSLYYKTAMRALLVGKTMAGMRVQDLLAVYGFMAGRADIDPARISIVGRGNMGVIALYAAALEKGIARVVAQGAVLSYMDLVRSPQCPETAADIIVPGVLRDFDLPDLAAAAGEGRIFLHNPVTTDGRPVGAPEAQSAYQGYAKVIAAPAPLLPGLLY